MLKPLILGAALALAAAGAAQADRGDRHHRFEHHQAGHGNRHHFCPPGLSGRGCTPPGQARKEHRRGHDDNHWSFHRDDDHRWRDRDDHRRWSDRDDRRWRDRHHGDRWWSDNDRWRDRRDDGGRVFLRLGHRVPDAYVLVTDPWRYGLDSNWRYYRHGNNFVRVDPDTLNVVTLLGILNSLVD
jgi:hypothetical protein